MMDYISQHKLLSLVLLVVLIGAAWWGFTSTNAPSSVVSTDAIGAATGTQDAAIVSTLLQLQAVALSGTIFSDPGFLSLQDFTTQVVTEPVGRTNPFAPTNSTTTVQSTSLNPNLFAPAKH